MEDLIESIDSAIADGDYPVEKLARSEYLGQAPAAYQKMVAEGRKPRRASLEAALAIDPLPRLGDRITYYLRSGDKSEKADWQRAVPLDHFDPDARPYDRAAYRKKLRQWYRRLKAGDGNGT